MTIPESFLVIVKCMTFNHHAYIEDAMNGFCMQKTDFPYLCIVMDDCSTDGEQEVIKKYVVEHFNSRTDEETDAYTLNLCQHKENENCYFAVFYLKYNHYSIKKDKTPYYARWQDKCKYIALCEGDDYWIDENKLQRQAVFLEENKEYSMVFHKAKIVYELGCEKTSLKSINIKNKEYKAKELLEHWIVPTASILCKKEMQQYPIKGDNRILNGDIFIVMKCCAIGKVWGMEYEMSVYRVQKNGVTYDKNLHKSRIMCYPQHFECLKENFPNVAPLFIRTRISSSYYDRAKIQASLSNKTHDYIMSFITNPLWFMATISGVKKIIKCVLTKTKVA